MKTLLYRVMISSLAVVGLMLVVGCEEEVANAEVPAFAAPAFAASAGAEGVTNSAAKTNSPAVLDEASPSNPADSEKANDAEKNRPPAIVVDKPMIPGNLKVSPALEEVIKLIQAGLGDDVIMSYVTNSTNLFNVGSDEIVYLNDLGVENKVITALIQHDSSPEMLAQKNAHAIAKPLPPGVALTTPATNVYPGQNVSQPAEPALPPSYEETAPVVTAPLTYEAPANVSYFYNSLAPYGSWVNVPDYGLCWQPTVAVVNHSWRPYCDRGRWLWSDSGWYWYSDYSWGWAPFHYGRWSTYPSVGWVWVPDTCWGPSWVSWRYNSSYCGWAPLPPGCGYVSGFGLYYGNHSVGIGFDFGLGLDCWTYIPLNHFCDRRPHLYYTSHGHAARLHRETTIVNNYVVGDNNTIINNGVGRDRVARATRSEIPRAAIREGALVTQNTRRPETLERSGSTLVVTRPQLPKEPPVQSRVVAAKLSTEPVKAAGVGGASLAPSQNNQRNALRAPRLGEQQPVRPSSPQSGGTPSVSSKPDSDSTQPSSASSAARGKGEDRPSIVRGSGQRPSAPRTEPPATSVAKSDGGEPRTSTPKAETSASVSKPVANPNAAANRPRPSRSSGVTPPLILGADPARSANSTPTPSQRSASSAGVRNFAVNTAPSEASGSSAGTAARSENGAGSGRPVQSITRPPSQPAPGAPAYGRPANVPSASRPQNATAAPARPERYRVYAEPPAASRPATPAPQAGRSEFQRPSGITTPLPAPAARSGFEAPRSVAPVRPSAPIMRSEAPRSAAPAPSSHSAAPAPSPRSAAPAPAQSGSSGRSQAPASSGGAGRGGGYGPGR